MTADITSVFADLDARSVEIPFGNSRFQNEHFVVGTQDGAGRQYRAALLRAQERRRAIEEAQHSRAVEDIDIEELELEIASERTTKGEPLSAFDVRRKRLELAKKRKDREYIEKLIKDALHELNDLYRIIRAHPAYTREEFEELEAGHFVSNLSRQIAGKTGAVESLEAMLRPDVPGVAPALLPSAPSAAVLPKE